MKKTDPARHRLFWRSGIIVGLAARTAPVDDLRPRRRQPLAASTLQDVMGVPAWKSLPSWFLVAADDEAIPPDAERLFASRMGTTIVEVPSSHVAMVSHPDEVAQLIKTAAEAVQAASPPD